MSKNLRNSNFLKVENRKIAYRGWPCFFRKTLKFCWLKVNSAILVLGANVVGLCASLDIQHTKHVISETEITLNFLGSQKKKFSSSKIEGKWSFFENWKTQVGIIFYAFCWFLWIDCWPSKSFLVTLNPLMRFFWDFSCKLHPMG